MQPLIIQLYHMWLPLPPPSRSTEGRCGLAVLVGHVAGVLAVPLGGDVPAVGGAGGGEPEHGEDERVQQDGVEEDEEARRLVPHRELHERQDDLLEDVQLAVSALPLLLFWTSS